MLQVEIRPAIMEDVPSIALALSEAVVRKVAHGDLLWGTEPYSDEDVIRILGAGGLYAVTCDGSVAGTVTLTKTDMPMWQEDGADPNKALYIHRLATSDLVRGNDVGARAINEVAHTASRESRRLLRLDCSYTNQQLCEYYAGLGFTEVARRDILKQSRRWDLLNPTYRAALLQRDV